MDNAARKKLVGLLDLAGIGANDAQHMQGIEVLWILRNNFSVEALRLRNPAALMRLYRLVEQGRRQMTGLSSRFTGNAMGYFRAVDVNGAP